MTERKKNPATQFVSETLSVRLANFFIRVAWKTTAGVIAVFARLFTSIILTIVRVVQRNRTTW